MNKYIKLIAYKTLMKKKMEMAEAPKEDLTQSSMGNLLKANGKFINPPKSKGVLPIGVNKPEIDSWFDFPKYIPPLSTPIVQHYKKNDPLTVADRKGAVAVGKLHPINAPDVDDAYADDIGKSVYDVLRNSLKSAEKEKQTENKTKIGTKTPPKAKIGVLDVINNPNAKVGELKHPKSRLEQADEKFNSAKNSLRRYESMIYTKQFGGTENKVNDNVDDITYKYINDLDPNLKVKMVVGGSRRSTVTDGELLDELTPAEKNIYNGVYNAYGKEKADEYLETLKVADGGLSDRYLGTVKKEAETFAKDMPVLAAGYSVYNNVLDGAMVVAKPFVDKKEAPIVYEAGVQTSTIRQTQRDSIDSPALKVAYDVGMGVADMGAAMALGYAFGGGSTQAVKTITGVIMSSSAGSSAMSEARDRGYSDLQVASAGIASAAIEMLTERFSIEVWFEEPTKIVTYLVQNFASEASEEFVSNICNTIADTIIGGDKSRIISTYNELVANEYTAQKATQYIFKAEMESAVYDSLVGGLTGFAMGSMRAVPYSISRNIKLKAVGRTVNKTKGGTSGLIGAASVDFSSKETKKYASRLENKINNGKTVSEYQTGKLYDMLSTDVGKYIDSAKTVKETVTAAKTLNDMMVNSGLASVMYKQVETALNQKSAELTKPQQKEIPDWKKTPYYTALYGEAKNEAFTEAEIETAEENRKATQEAVLSNVSEACAMWEAARPNGESVETNEVDNVDISSAQAEAARDKAEGMIDDDFDMERGYLTIPERIIDEEGYVVGEATPVTASQEQSVSPIGETEANNGVRFSFNDTESGMANDNLQPYSEELRDIIEQQKGFVVDSYDKLIEVVDIAFNEPDRKGTAYFGILNPEVLAKIENSIPNLPKELNGTLFKTGKTYSIAATLDSIRHIVDDKKLTREDVLDYLDRLSDTIIDFDSVNFNYYLHDGQKINGVLFKKKFVDGVVESFELVSHKTRSLKLQTIYIEKGDYKKKKFAETMLMDNPQPTPEAKVSQTSNNIIPNSAENVNTERIGGVIPGTIVAEENLTAEQREAIDVANSRGVTVKVFEPLGKFSNFKGFCAKDGTVYISTTANIPTQTAIHEFAHYGEKNAKKYKKYREAVLKTKMFKTWIMQEVNGAVDIESAIEKKCNDYIAAATELNESLGEEVIDTSFTTAEREVIAEFSESELFRESGIEALKKENGVVEAEKRTIVDYIKAALRWITQRFSLSGHKKMLANKASELQKLERLYSQMLDSGDTDVEVKYSLKNDSSIKEQIKYSSNILNSMDVIGTANETKTFANDQEATDWVLKKIEGMRNVVVRENFGEIVFDKKRIKKGLGYLKTNVEKLAFSLVPDVIKNGVEIGRHLKHKGRTYNTITFAGPVILNGQRGNMAVVVIEDGKNYYRVHRLVLPDGSMFTFNEKRDTTETAGGVNENSGLSPTDNVSINSIRENSENVKENSSKGSASVDFAASKGVSVEDAIESEDYVVPVEQNTEQDTEQNTEPTKETYTAEEFRKAIAEAEKRGEAKARGEERQKQKVKTETKKISEQRRTKIGTIMRRSKWLADKLITNSKTKHIPEVFKDILIQFLLNIDYSSARKLKGGPDTKMDKTFQWITSEVLRIVKEHSISEDGSDGIKGNLDINPELIEKMEKLRDEVNSKFSDSKTKEVLRELSLEQLDTIEKFVINLGTAIKQTSENYAVRSTKNADELGKKSIRIFNEFKHLRTEAKNIVKFNWNLSLPVYAFERLEKPGEELFGAFMDGLDKHAELSANSEEYLDSVFEKYNVTNKDVRKWESEKHKVTLGPMAQEFEISTAQIMDLYNLQKREQALTHMTREKYEDGNDGQGIVVAEFKTVKEKKNGKKSIFKETLRKSKTSGTLSTGDINKLCNMLTETQKAVADAMFKYMPECAKWGNEVYMRRYGYEQFKETNYWPIESSEDYLGTNVEDRNQSVYSLMNPGFSKNTVKHANNPLMVRSIFEVYSHHVAEMAQFRAFTLPMVDIIRWLNFKQTSEVADGTMPSSVKEALKNAHGEDAYDYIITLLKDLNGASKKSNIMESYMLRILKRAKQASVGSNLRVVALQPTSYFRARQELSYIDLMYGLKHCNTKAAKKNCGIVRWKAMGYYDTDITKSVEEKLRGNKTAYESIIEKSMALAGKADELTLGCLWGACEHYVMRKKPNLEKGSEEFKKAVAEKLRTVVYKTQVVDSVLTRSTVMREKSGKMREVTAFMSEPILSYNQLMDAYNKYQNDIRKGLSKKEAFSRNKNVIARNISAYLLTSLLGAVVESIADALRDEDDEEFLQKFLDALLGLDGNLVSNLNPLEKIPFIADIVNIGLRFASSSIKGESFVNFSSGGINDTAIQNAMNAAFDLYKAFYEDDSKFGYGKIYSTIQAFSQLSGLPMSNAIREVVTVWNNTAGAADTELIIRRKKVGNKVYYEKIYDAIGDKDDFQAQMDKAYGVGLKRSQIMTGIKNLMLEDKELVPRIEKANKAMKKRDETEKHSDEWWKLDNKYQELLFDIVNEGFPEDVVLKAVEGYKTEEQKDAEDKLNDKVEAKAESLIDQCMKRIYESNVCKDLNAEQKAEVEKKVTSYAYAISKADFDKACELSLQHKKVKAAESVGIDPVRFYSVMAQTYGNTKAAKLAAVNNSKLTDEEKADMRMIVNATNKSVDNIGKYIKEN